MSNNRFEPMNLMNDNKHNNNNKNKNKKIPKQQNNNQTQQDNKTTPKQSGWNQQHIISKIKLNGTNNQPQTEYVDPLLLRAQKYKNAVKNNQNIVKNTDNMSDSDNDHDAVSICSDVTTKSETERRDDQEFEDRVLESFYPYWDEYYHYKSNYTGDNFRQDVVDHLMDHVNQYCTPEEFMDHFHYYYDQD